MFFESVNAIGVLRAPAVISVWDDGYGISVPNEFQMTKGSVSEVLAGLQRKEGDHTGYDVYVVKGWDYPALVDVYAKAATTAREEHVPALIHVVDMTQPQGHSTSGSHERYKSAERLQWEVDFDPITKMRDWMIAEGIATDAELDAIDAKAVEQVRTEQQGAWQDYCEPITEEVQQAVQVIQTMAANSSNADALNRIAAELDNKRGTTYRLDVMTTVSKKLRLLRGRNSDAVPAAY